jgi:hypothetical protein
VWRARQRDSAAAHAPVERFQTGLSNACCPVALFLLEPGVQKLGVHERAAEHRGVFQGRKGGEVNEEDTLEELFT